LRILLDECVPRGLKQSFGPDHIVQTVPEAGFAGLSNGELLNRVNGNFEVLLTIDKSIRFQQNLAKYQIAFVLLRVLSNDIADVEPLMPKFFARFDEMAAGQLLVIE
jgi:hypothetical protein